MSQLPGTIHVKRKLVEEPPETLCKYLSPQGFQELALITPDIEREGHDPNAADQHARPVYRLLQAAKRLRTSSYAKSPSGVSSMAQLTQPQESRVEVNEAMLALNSVTIPAAINGSQVTQSDQSKPKDARTPRQRRIFHLSLTRTIGLSRISSSSSLRASSRRRGRNLISVAVFAEKRALLAEQMARSMINSRPVTPLMVDGSVSEGERSRKRPPTQSLSALESKGLTKSASIISTEEEDSEASLALAAELRQFALDTTEMTSSADTTRPVASVPQIFRKKPMKYQPRPPPPRNIPDVAISEDVPVSGSQNASNDIVMGEDDSTDWVYDVYVRDVIGPSNQESTRPKDSIQEAADLGVNENVGYLIIRSEDEQAWEEFMSDEEDSEGDWGGEDEDSNGKLLTTPIPSFSRHI